MTLVQSWDEQHWAAGLMVWPIIHTVTPQLAISDVYAAKHEKTLEQHGITHILSLLSYASIEPVPSFITNLKLDILDYPDENILDEFSITNKFIDDAVRSGGKVLIHCQAGISRSSTVLCAYLMKSQDLTRDAAFKLIKDQRSHVRPNEGFWEQLKVYEECRHQPIKGQAAYDAWLKKFYAWGGEADPGKSGTSKL